MKAWIFGSWGAHWAEIARPRSLNSHNYGTGGLQTHQKIAIALPQFIATYCTKLLAKKGGHTWPGTGSRGHSMECGCYPVFFFLALSLSLSYASFTFFIVDAVVWLKLCCQRSFQPVLQGPQHGRPPSGKGKGKGAKANGKGSFSESNGGKGTKREAATATTKDSLTSLSKFIAWAKQIHFKDAVVIQYLWYDSCCECAQIRKKDVVLLSFFFATLRGPAFSMWCCEEICVEKNISWLISGD